MAADDPLVTSRAVSGTLLKLPGFAHFEAPASWTAIDFISDLHLWPQGPRTFEAWAAYMRASKADAIFILGDLFEVWVGDDSLDLPFEASCLRVLNESSMSRFIGFMHGNRDFLVGEQMLADSGVTLLDDPTVLECFGSSALLSHGDELCLGDVDYQRFRLLVRSAAWQQQFLKQPLTDRQQQVRALRNESEQRKMGNLDPTEWVDLDLSETRRWMTAAATPALVHGHTHKPCDQDIGTGFVRHVLSDWDLDPADESHRRAEVLRLSASGFQRMTPLQASA